MLMLIFLWLDLIIARCDESGSGPTTEAGEPRLT
jgi:hypothetical protein